MIKYEEYIPKTAKGAQITHICVAAHKDDGEMLALHGIKNCYEDGGFGLIVLTDGGNCPKAGKYSDLSYEDMVEIRTEEQKRAATFGKYEKVYFFDLPSQTLEERKDEIAKEITNIIDSNPNIEYVYSHSIFDRHKTHINACKLTIEGVRQSKNKKNIKNFFGVELWRDLDWIEEKDLSFLDVSGSCAFAMQLLSYFESQNQSKMYNRGFCGRLASNATFSNSHSNSECTEVMRAVDMTKLLMGNKNDEIAFIKEKIRDFQNIVIGDFS